MKKIYLSLVLLCTIHGATAQCTECRSFDQARKNPGQVRSLIINSWVDKTYLDSVPVDIDIFENLEILYLSDQAIASIPPAVGRLKKLKELSFANCKLKTVPGFVFGMTHLRELILNDNPFSTTEIKSIRNRVKAEMPRTKLIL